MILHHLFASALLLFSLQSMVSADNIDHEVIHQTKNGETNIILGRSTFGEWMGLSYEIVYFADIVTSGPHKKMACLQSAMEQTFRDVSITNDPDDIQFLAIEQWERAHRDTVKAKAEMMNRSFKNSEERKDKQGRTFYSPKKRVSDRFSGMAGHPPADKGRGGLSYNFETAVAVYLNDKYVNLYDDETILAVSTPMDFQAFVQKAATHMLSPPPAPTNSPSGEEQEDSSPDPWSYFDDDDDYHNYPQGLIDAVSVMKASDACNEALGSDFWGEEDEDLLYNTPVLGRSAAGDFGDTSYEVQSFLEVFRVSGLGSDEERACFFNKTDSLFFKDQISTQAGSGAVSVSKLTSEQQVQARRIAREEETVGNKTSIFWSNSVGSSGCSGFSIQHGVVILLDGQSISSFDDAPEGFEAFAATILDGLIATPFYVKDSMDFLFEVNLTRDYDLTEVLAGWYEECKHYTRH